MKSKPVVDIGKQVVSAKISWHRLVDKVNRNALMIQPHMSQQQFNQWNIDAPLVDRDRSDELGIRSSSVTLKLEPMVVVNDEPDDVIVV